MVEGQSHGKVGRVRGMQEGNAQPPPRNKNKETTEGRTRWERGGGNRESGIRAHLSTTAKNRSAQSIPVPSCLKQSVINSQTKSAMCTNKACYACQTMSFEYMEMRSGERRPGRWGWGGVSACSVLFLFLSVPVPVKHTQCHVKMPMSCFVCFRKGRSKGGRQKKVK